MSAIGKRIWLLMQEHEPPYNRSALAKKWTRDGTFPTTAQSISNYLYKEHPPPDFVNAIAKEFELSPQEESELHWLYFYGDALQERRTAQELAAKYELDPKGLQRRLERLERRDFLPEYDEREVIPRHEEHTKDTP